ncbi:MAG TPA: thioredoxin domain-containing protein [Rubrobacteraceae bacterium]|nr:thioredoxin domain-containing protein [Rubrobacteraceae bacterium]
MDILNQESRLTAPVRGSDHVRGPENAPVTLVQYGDYECPHCARAHPVVREALDRADGRLRFVFRHFPLDSVHQNSRLAAEAAEAAGAQGMFWEMHDLLYEERGRLSESDLVRHAARLGLDSVRFEEDLTSRRHAARLSEDRAGGERSGVGGTPTFFLNGVRYRGSLDAESLLAEVERIVGGSEASPRVARDPIDEVCSEDREVDTRTLKKVVQLAVEIAREGREGRKIGTLFVVGDSEAVMERSKPLILDPLFGHPDEAKRIEDPNARETIKELAQLDGAFVISDGGVVLSATRYVDAVSDDLELPLGLGSRHVAGASVSSRTNAVAVVVSESSMVRVFDDGKVVAEIVPEIWMLNGYAGRFGDPYRTRNEGEFAVVRRRE